MVRLDRDFYMIERMKGGDAVVWLKGKRVDQDTEDMVNDLLGGIWHIAKEMVIWKTVTFLILIGAVVALWMT